MAISDRQVTSRYVGRRMTLDEFLALPEQAPALELDDGLVTQKMSPEVNHGAVAVTFTVEMNRVASQRKLGKAAVEVRFRARGATYVPDASYYRKERLHLRGPKRFAQLQDSPDIAVEVVSPGQSVIALIRKCVKYLDLGVPVAVLADPEDETVLVFRPGPLMRVLQGDDRIDLDDVLPGFDLTPRRLFDSIVPDWLVSSPDDGESPAGA